MPEQVKNQKSGVIFAGLLTGVFLILGFIVALHHEMWRDELQVWSIVGASRSITDLFHNIRYEGHPGLWHLLVFLTHKLSDNPFSMQILHLCIAAGVVYLFARHAPFARAQKMLFTFGFYTFYKYAIIARNYAVGNLLIFAFCALFPHRQKRLLLIACVLFLLANCSIYGWIAAVALGVTLIVSYFRDSRSGKAWQVPGWILLASLTVVAAGLVVSLLQIRPPADATHVALLTSFQPRRTLAVFDLYARGFFMIPWPFPEEFHLRSLATNCNSVVLPLAVVSAALISYSLLLFSQRRLALAAYCSALAGYFSFAYVVFAGWGLRHHGMFYIIFIASLWIAAYCPREKTKWQAINRAAAFCEDHQRAFLTGFLVLHLMVGVKIAVQDIAKPYSASKAAAEYIKADNLEDRFIIGDSDCTSSGVASYLGRQFYYAASDRLGSFVVWDNKPRSLKSNEVVSKLGAIERRGKKDPLFVLSYQLSNDQCKQLNLHLQKSFTGTIIEDESIWIYSEPYTLN